MCRSENIGFVMCWKQAADNRTLKTVPYKITKITPPRETSVPTAGWLCIIYFTSEQSGIASAFPSQRLPADQPVPQAVINAFLCQQFLVAALFLNAGFAQHQNAVSVFDGGQAVGNRQRGAALGQLCPTRISLSLSSALVASSSSRMGGFFKNTRAMLMRCFCPPESLTPRSPT